MEPHQEQKRPREAEEKRDGDHGVLEEVADDSVKGKGSAQKERNAREAVPCQGTLSTTANAPLDKKPTAARNKA